MPSLDVTLLAQTRPKRLSAGAWLLFNLRVGGLTFGMGSITPIFERTLVQDTQSLTAEEFRETLTLAQVLPGPSLVSMTMHLGQRLFGPTFALLGVVCLCLPGALWATLIVRWLPFERPLVQALMHGFAVGAAVLVADFLRRLSKLVRRLAVALTVTALISARVPMFAVVAAGVLAGLGAEFLP